MVFSSLPVYLDPPNWPQQQDPQQGGGPGEINSLQLPPLMPPPPPPVHVGGGDAAAASINRPGSVAERARLAKLPQPEASLKCPRCESSNTKFCYFNNYSLTQPRHFCKTCRRYWTRGGALRSVPVGGGCRRNKRSKGSSRSKSPITSDHKSSSTSTSAVSSNGCSSENIMSHHLQLPAHQTQLPFFPPLHNLTDFGNADIGLSFGGVQPQVGTSGINGSEIEFQIGNSTSAGMGSVGPLNLSARFADQWRSVQQVPHFPFLGGLEQFDAGCMDQPLGYGGGSTDHHQLGSKTILEASPGVLSVKLEENHQQGPNFSRNFLSAQGNNQHYWGSTGNAWTDLSGSTSSATHLM